MYIVRLHSKWVTYRQRLLVLTLEFLLVRGVTRGHGGVLPITRTA